MRKLIVTVVAATLVTTGLIAIEQVFPIHQEQSGPITQIVRLPDLTQELLDRFTLSNDIAIECPKGTLIPVKFFLSGEFLACDTTGSPACVEVSRTFYVRRGGDAFLFSLDLRTWKSPLELITGTAVVSLDVADGIPSLRVGADFYERR